MGKQGGHLAVADVPGETSRGAICRDLVMFDFLSRGDEREIGGAFLFLPALFDYLLALFHQARHAFARFRLRRFAEQLESALEPLNMPFGLLKVHQKRGLELWLMRSLGHFRKS